MANIRVTKEMVTKLIEDFEEELRLLKDSLAGMDALGEDVHLQKVQSPSIGMSAIFEFTSRIHTAVKVRLSENQFGPSPKTLRQDRRSQQKG